jgi:hypothetical protein
MKPITIDYVFWPAPVRRYSFREHLQAAEAGGFTSLAVAPEAYRQAISSGLSAKDMVKMAGDKGVALRHLDTLTDWAPIRVPLEIDAGLRSRFDVSADECFAICEALGSETILAVAGYDKGAIPLEYWSTGLVNCAIAQAQRGATLFEDTVRFRKFPGEGELPIVEILTILHQKGQLRRIGPEVFSDEADAMSPEIAGKRSGESLRRVLHTAGIPSSEAKK